MEDYIVITYGVLLALGPERNGAGCVAVPQSDGEGHGQRGHGLGGDGRPGDLQSHPANCLMARIGSRVPAGEHCNKFDAMRFQHRYLLLAEYLERQEKPMRIERDHAADGSITVHPLSPPVSAEALKLLREQRHSDTLPVVDQVSGLRGDHLRPGPGSMPCRPRLLASRRTISTAPADSGGGQSCMRQVITAHPLDFIEDAASLQIYEHKVSDRCHGRRRGPAGGNRHFESDLLQQPDRTVWR
jgi:hypothetical protein